MVTLVLGFPKSAASQMGLKENRFPIASQPTLTLAYATSTPHTMPHGSMAAEEEAVGYRKRGECLEGTSEWKEPHSTQTLATAPL